MKFQFGLPANGRTMRIWTLSLVGTARLRRPRRVQRRNGRELRIGHGLFRPLLRGWGWRKRAIPTLVEEQCQDAPLGACGIEQKNVECVVTIYHVMSRGDRREDIFLDDDAGRGLPEGRLAGACLASALIPTGLRHSAQRCSDNGGATLGS